MADNATQMINEAQEANRAFCETIQGMTGTHINILQRLGDVQRGVFNQAFEATNDQLQLVSRVRDPREFAAAQADLVKDHGQRYVESVKEAVDVVVEAWQEYGNRIEKGVSAATDKAQRAASRK